MNVTGDPVSPDVDASTVQEPVVLPAVIDEAETPLVVGTSAVAEVPLGQLCKVHCTLNAGVGTVLRWFASVTFTVGVGEKEVPVDASNTPGTTASRKVAAPGTTVKLFVDPDVTASPDIVNDVLKPTLRLAWATASMTIPENVASPVASVSAVVVPVRMKAPLGAAVTCTPLSGMGRVSSRSCTVICPSVAPFANVAPAACCCTTTSRLGCVVSTVNETGGTAEQFVIGMPATHAVT